MVFHTLRQRLVQYFPADTLRARFARGAAWVLLGMGLSQLVAAVASVVIARALGQEMFGEFGMVRNTVMMFGTLAGFGLGITTNKFMAELRDSDPARAGRVLALSVTLAAVSGAAVSLLVAGTADYIAAHTLGARHLAGYIRICTPVLLLSVLGGVQLGAISGLEQFRVLSLVSTATGLIVAVTGALGALLWGIEGAFYGTVLGSFINLVLLEGVVTALRRRKGIGFSFSGMWRERPILFSFALPSMLAGIMVAPVTWAGLRLLFIRPNGAAETALFHAAGQLRMLVLFVPGALAQVVLPVLSNLQAGGGAGRYQRAVRLAALASLAASAAVAIPLMAGSPQLMGLFGPSFSSGWLVLCLMCAAAVLQATNNVIGEALAALSKMWWGFWLNCLWAVEFLIAAWLLVRYGAAGLAGAYLISYLLHTVQVWILVSLAIRYRRSWQGSPVQVPGAAGDWV